MTRKPAPFPLRPRVLRLDIKPPAASDSPTVDDALRSASDALLLSVRDCAFRYLGGKTGCRYEITAPQQTSNERLREVVGIVEDAAKMHLPGCSVSVPSWLNGHGRWRVETAAEIASRPPLRWLVRGVLPAAEFGTLYGPPGSGKSFLALDLAACVQRGAPFAGHAVPAPGRVVIVAAEGANGWGQRVAAYARRHELDPGRDLPGLLFACPDLRVPQDVADLSAALSSFGVVDLLVLDTWAAMQPGADENSSKDAGKALAACKHLAATHGCTVLAVAHVGKDATRGERGWSGVRAAADVAIEVQRDAGGRRSWIVRKMKDGEETSAQPFTLKPVDLGVDDYGAPIVSAVVDHDGELPRRHERRESKHKLALREALDPNEHRLTADVIREICGDDPEIKPDSMRRAIARMAKDGEIYSADSLHTISWSLPEEAADERDWLRSA